MSEKSTTRITTDHEEIKNWILKHGGKPSRVKENGEAKGGILRVDMVKEDEPEEELQEISWEDFFETFEKKRLAFLYEDGPKSRFSKFIGRD